MWDSGITESPVRLTGNPRTQCKVGLEEMERVREC